MKHFATPSFWEKYYKLPIEVKKLADKQFELLKSNLHHPSLKLKNIGNLWSVRIGQKHRALGINQDTDIIWFWIGSHSDYNKMI